MNKKLLLLVERYRLRKKVTFIEKSPEPDLVATVSKNAPPSTIVILGKVVYCDPEIWYAVTGFPFLKV